MKRSTACLTALLGCFLFASMLVAGSWWSAGQSIGQRVMTDLVMPVGLAWLVALAATIYQWRRGNRPAAAGSALAFLAIWGLFCPPIVGLVVAATEAPPLSRTPLSAQAPDYPVVVVLGGGASRNAAGQAELTGAGERLALAAKLWHAGKVKAIVCTGTAQPRVAGASPPQEVGFEADDPAEIGREILTALGVAEQQVFRSAGENTAAEMRHLSVFFQSPPPGLPTGSPRGLITSAFHLPRAMRLAQGAELDFEPLPAGSRALARNDRGIGILVPTAGAGEAMAMVAKEWLARLLGR